MYLNHPLVPGFALTLRYGEERDREYLATIFAEIWAEIPDNERAAILSRGYGDIVVDVLDKQGFEGLSNTGGDFRLKRSVVDLYPRKPWSISWPTVWPKRWWTSSTPTWLPGRTRRAGSPGGGWPRFSSGGATQPNPRWNILQPTKYASGPPSARYLPSPKTDSRSIAGSSRSK